jgi:hypothetical protein
MSGMKRQFEEYVSSRSPPCKCFFRWRELLKKYWEKASGLCYGTYGTKKTGINRPLDMAKSYPCLHIWVSWDNDAHSINVYGLPEENRVRVR